MLSSLAMIAYKTQLYYCASALPANGRGAVYGI